jgi:hypothetical protein
LVVPVGVLVSFGVATWFVAPRIGLRPRHDASNIGIFAVRAFSTGATACACFSTPRRFLLLLLRSSALALPLAPRQWISCSHLALL